MLGHDDVSAYDEAVPLANFVENGKKQVPTIGRAQDRPTVIATARNEVQMLQSVVSRKLTGHDGRVPVAERAGCDVWTSRLCRIMPRSFAKSANERASHGPVLIFLEEMGQLLARFLRVVDGHFGSFFRSFGNVLPAICGSVAGEIERFLSSVCALDG